MKKRSLVLLSLLLLSIIFYVNKRENGGVRLSRKLDDTSNDIQTSKEPDSSFKIDEKRRLTTENKRIDSEEERERLENERKEAEEERKKLENERKRSEEVRKKVEEERLKAEIERRKAEEERKKVEEERVKVEEERVKAEEEREKAEVERKKAEEEREKAEVERKKAEEERKKLTKKIELDKRKEEERKEKIKKIEEKIGETNTQQDSIEDIKKDIQDVGDVEDVEDLKNIKDNGNIEDIKGDEDENNLKYIYSGEINDKNLQTIDDVLEEYDQNKRYKKSDLCDEEFIKSHAIVSAVSSNHLFSLTHILYRMNERYPCETIIIYSLGLTKEERNYLTEINRRYAPLHIIDFDYSKYPSYFNVSISAGEYAWKPAIIHQVLSKFDYVLWIDGGTHLYGTPVLLYEFLKEGGFFSVVSGGDVQKWTHPLTLKFFNIKSDDKILKQINCNAAELAFYAPLTLRQLVTPWRNCALKRECIAPIGSNRGNHRQDQAIITLLVQLSKGQFECKVRKFPYFRHHIDKRVEGLVGMNEIYKIPVPAYFNRIVSIDSKGTECTTLNNLSNNDTETKNEKILNPICFSPFQVIGFLTTFVCDIDTVVQFVQLGGSFPENFVKLLGKKSTITWIRNDQSDQDHIPKIYDSDPDIKILESISDVNDLLPRTSKGLVSNNVIYNIDLIDDANFDFLQINDNINILSNMMTMKNWKEEREKNHKEDDAKWMMGFYSDLGDGDVTPCLNKMQKIADSFKESHERYSTSVFYYFYLFFESKRYLLSLSSNYNFLNVFQEEGITKID